MVAGASATFTLVANVPSGAAAGASYSNTATVSSPDPDPNGTNNASTAVTTISSADLSASIADSPDPVTAGEDLTYALTVSNNGPDGAVDAALTDTLPAGTTFASLVQDSGPAWSCTTPAVGSAGTIACTNAAVASGSVATFTLVVRVAPALSDGTVLSNTITASSATRDPRPGDETATAATNVAAPSPSPPPGPGHFRPTVTSVSPASGEPGSAVTITGAGFAGTSQVLFGHVSAASYVVDGHQRITAVVPAGLSGTVDVRVVNAQGISPIALGGRFTAAMSPPLSLMPITPHEPPPGAAACRMPELTGHRLRDVLRILRRDGCHVRVRHSGRGRHGRARVRSQRPEAGTVLRQGQVVRVRVR
jgi:uncharacterized repeat protein (TIGR01451 family)